MCVSVAALVYGYVRPCSCLKSFIIIVMVQFVIIGLSWRVRVGWPVWTISFCVFCMHSLAILQNECLS